MFNSNFYPTPKEVIVTMLEGEILANKTILEPSAGKGDIVDFCISSGATLLACELNEDLYKIVSTKCQMIGKDFLELQSDKISHVDMIIMNPPFDNAGQHILHAFNIAPPGCKIISLCNYATLENRHSSMRKELQTVIDTYGETPVNLGDCFSQSERQTSVQVGLIKLQKAGSNYSTEFEGFFTDEEPEEIGQSGLMSYNVVRDLVNRYVGSIKIFDEQLLTAVKLNSLLSGVFSNGRENLSISISKDAAPIKRGEFKKDMQKCAWHYIFNKMNMQKYATQGLKEDINKFVETQIQIPFTMRNIYKMLEIVIGTQGTRMDKALLEVFDKLTSHYHDNRFNVEGWKTNSHYLVNKTFIMPHVVEADFSGGIRCTYHGWAEPIEDMQKALCYITGMNYDNCTRLADFLRNNKCTWGQWYSWGFFEIKSYKKGTTHFKFQDENLWGQFNQRISRLKGYPLYEHKPQTKWQERQRRA